MLLPSFTPMPVPIHPSFKLPSASPRVLLVEDDAVLALVVMEQLRTLGCEVSLVENGWMAVQAWAGTEVNESFDLVLMDLQMPVMNGVQAMRRIRRLEEDQRHRAAPIVAFSTCSFDERGMHLPSSGFDDFLPKPCELRQLAALLRRWVPQARLRAVA